MTYLDDALLAAHQDNVRRYRRILDTPLTDFERQFVEHRLYEEEDAIRLLLARRPSSPYRTGFPTDAGRPSPAVA